jgi:hypothetical protein
VEILWLVQSALSANFDLCGHLVQRGILSTECLVSELGSGQLGKSGCLNSAVLTTSSLSGTGRRGDPEEITRDWSLPQLTPTQAIIILTFPWPMNLM